MTPTVSYARNGMAARLRGRRHATGIAIDRSNATWIIEIRSHEAKPPSTEVEDNQPPTRASGALDALSDMFDRFPKRRSTRPDFRESCATL